MAEGRAQSPNEELASIIAEALAGAGLIPRAELNEIEQQLAAGKVTERDWRWLIESALPDRRPEESDGPGD